MRCRFVFLSRDLHRESVARSGRWDGHRVVLASGLAGHTEVYAHRSRQSHESMFQLLARFCNVSSLRPPWSSPSLDALLVSFFPPLSRHLSSAHRLVSAGICMCVYLFRRMLAVSLLVCARDLGCLRRFGHSSRAGPQARDRQHARDIAPRFRTPSATAPTRHGRRGTSCCGPVCPPHRLASLPPPSGVHVPETAASPTLRVGHLPQHGQVWARPLCVCGRWGRRLRCAH